MVSCKQTFTNTKLARCQVAKVRKLKQHEAADVAEVESGRGIGVDEE